MKYSLQKRISAFVLAFALVMTTAFNSIGATTKADAAAAKVKTLYLTKKVTSATVGDSFTAQWAVRATKATKAMAKVTVKSSDTSVVKVTKTTQSKKAGTTAKKAKKTKGTATLSAVGAGEAKITITTVKKTKKKKKLSKSFTVNVAAKETPASSETPVTPSGDASKDPVKTVESLNVVASNGTTIGETEQTTLTVTSGTEGAAIATGSVKFESENPAILSVSEAGVVTGLKAGTANVIVTASDLAGKVITKKVAITVVELQEAKVTLPDNQKSLSLLVGGESVKLTPTVAPATLQSAVVFESSAPDVVSVSADGTVTALKAGTGTTISIKVKGAKVTGDVSVPVTAVANGYGIASFNAVKANQLKVEFTTPVSAADQKKINFTLKLAQEVKPTVSFDASGAFAILTSPSSTYESGTYSVEISGTGVVIDKTKATATTKVDAPKATTIKVESATYAPSSKVKVKYSVLDQYGDKMSNFTSDKLSWNISYKDASIRTADAQTSIATNATADKGDGYVNVNLSAAGDIKTAFDKDPNAILDFTVTAYLANDIKTNGSGTISIKKVKIASVQILGLASSDGKTAVKTDRFVDDTALANTKLLLAGTDENGTAIDWTAYNGGGYANTITFSQNNNTIISAFNNGATALKDNEPNDDGQIVTKFAAGKTGKVTFSAVVAGNMTGSDTWTMEVKSARKANEIIFPSNLKVRIGASVDVPLTFKDQYGDAFVPTTIPATNFNWSGAGLSGGTFSYGGGSAANFDVSWKDAKTITLTAGANITGKSLSLVATSTLADYVKTSTTTVALEDKASIASVSMDGAKKFSTFNATDLEGTVYLLENETLSFNVFGVDQDKNLVLPETTGDWSVAVEVPANAHVKNVVASGVTNAIKCNTKALTINSKAAEGVAFSLDGDTKGSDKILIKFYKGTTAAQTEANLVKTITLNVNVTETPTKFDAEIVNKTVTAGDKVTIRFKADKTGFSGTGTAVVGELLTDKASEAGVTANPLTVKTTKEITFKDGVGEVTVTASKACTSDDNKNYYGGYIELKNTVKYGSVVGSHPTTIEGVDLAKLAYAGINVKAGAVAKILASVATDGVITAKLYDAQNNPIAVKSDTKVYGSAIGSDGTQIAAALAFSKVDSESGLLSVKNETVTSNVPQGDGITSKIDKICNGGKVTLTCGSAKTVIDLSAAGATVITYEIADDVQANAAAAQLAADNAAGDPSWAAGLGSAPTGMTAGYSYSFALSNATGAGDSTATINSSTGKITITLGDNGTADTKTYTLTITATKDGVTGTATKTVTITDDANNDLDSATVS